MRILDAPNGGRLGGTAAAARREAADSMLLRRLTATANASEISSRDPPHSNTNHRQAQAAAIAPTPAAAGQETPPRGAMNTNTAPRHATTEHSHFPGCVSAPVSALKGSAPGAGALQGVDEEEECDDGGAWPLGSLSLPGSSTDTPNTDARKPRFSLGTDHEDNNDNNDNDDDDSPIGASLFLDGIEVRGGMAPTTTATVHALDESSPCTANFLAQYMADHVSVRASMQMKPRPKSGGHVYRAVTSSSPKAKGKIPAIRMSAPGIMKRSSFLQRPLVTADDLFGRSK